jgi:hypothetical protein
MSGDPVNGTGTIKPTRSRRTRAQLEQLDEQIFEVLDETIRNRSATSSTE